MIESSTVFYQAWIFILLSVLMHVSWNLMARYVSQQSDFLWWGLLGHIILLGGYGLYHLSLVDWSWHLAGLIAVTAVANSLYFLSLREAYSLAPVAFVYPIARSSPILVAVWAWLLFDEVLSPMAWLGIAISIIGLLVLGHTAKHSHDPKVLLWTISAAFFTSIYSLSDKAISLQVNSFSALLGVVTIGYLVSWIVLSIYRKKHYKTMFPKSRPSLIIWLFGSLFIGSAYALVILAMQSLPTAYVVAMTNLGIVLAVIITVIFFKERDHLTKKIVSTMLIVLGLMLLGLV